MSGKPLYYSNPAWSSTDPYLSTIIFDLTYTASPAVNTPRVTYSTLPFGAPVLAVFDINGTSSPTQGTIDAFLGTTNEFYASQFDAPVVNTTGFAMLLDMGGQAKSVAGARAFAYPTTGLQPGPAGLVGASPTIPYTTWASSGTLSSIGPGNVIQIGDQGNIGIQFNMTDGAAATWATFYNPTVPTTTPGQLVVQFFWMPV